jgi:hypothetical protein
MEASSASILVGVIFTGGLAALAAVWIFRGSPR